MERTLTLPHPLKPGANAYLEVQVGPLAPGQRVRVTTQSGEPIGTIAPFGPAARGHAGAYSLPVPPNAITDGTLSLRVTVTRPSAPDRAPTETEVKGLRLLAPDAPQ
jgi:hypothetical protein